MANFDFICDVDGKRLVSNFLSTRTVRPEDAVFGDKPTVNIRFVEANRNNVELPWRYLDVSSGYSARVAIGNPGGDPTAGTFTLTHDSNETSELDITSATLAADIEAALEALASISAVTVTAVSAGYQIDWDAVGAQTAITADTTRLFPSSSATIYESIAGDGSTKETQVLTLEVDNAAYAELTTNISAPSSTITVAREGVTDTTSELVRVAISGDPHSGTFQITVDGETTDSINITTGTLADIEGAVDALASIGTGNTTVTGGITDFTLQFDKSLGNIGTVTVDTANLTGAENGGFTGTFDLNTNEFLELLAGAASVQSTLEIVLYDTGSSTSDTVIQETITCRQDVIPDTPPSATGLPTYAAASHTHTESDISDLGTLTTMNADADVSGNSWVLDEDTLVSDSSTKLATQQSIKAYVDTQISGLGNSMEFKGSYDANTTDPTDGGIGDTYVVTVAGDGVGDTFWTTALEVGDVIIQENDPATTEADWVVVSKDFAGNPLINVIEDTTPALGGMLDVNGNAIGDGTLELVKFTETGSAVNEITIANAATAGAPQISATGDDVSINLDIQAKGAGNITLGNYTFDSDATVGAGQDDMVLTYDNGTGLISLESPAGDVATDSIFDAKGDIVGGTGADTAARLAVGTDGQLLTADSAEATGLKWTTAPGSGDFLAAGTVAMTGNLDINTQSLEDANANELLSFGTTASAVNELTVTNAATAGAPQLSATGDDANIDLDLQPKGTGNITLGNYTLDADATVGAGQDDMVLTYDNGTGTIALEAAAGGSIATETTFGLVEFATQAEVEAADDTPLDQVVRAKHMLVKKEGTNGFSFGDLGGDARGSNSITIQPNRTSSSQMASGSYAIAIGGSALASSTYAIAVGFGSDAGSSCVAIGRDADAGTGSSATSLGHSSAATGVFSTSIGYSTVASGADSSAIGYDATASGTDSTAVGHSTDATQTRSVAMGYLVQNGTANAAEFGTWSSTSARWGSIRFDSTGQSSLTLEDSSSAPADGGATAGSESAGTLPRGMYAVRRNGEEIWVDMNSAGTVTSYQVGGQHPRADVYVSSSSASNAITATAYLNLLANATIADAGLTDGFTIDDTNKRATYTGLDDRVFMVQVSVGMTASISNEIARFRLAKNGTTIAATEIPRKVGTGSDVGALAVQGMVSLATNDYIELHGTLDASTSDTITVENCNLSITAVN